MTTSARVLVADDDPSIRLALCDRIASLGHRVFEAASCGETREVLKARELDLVLLDWQLPDGGGMALLEEIIKLGESIEVIVITAYGTIPAAVESIRRGAFDFVTKPFEFVDFEARIEKALECRRLKRETASFRAERMADFAKRVVATSGKMAACVEAARQVAITETTVLILGETGTGKGVLAHYLHAASSRSDKPFVVLSCTNFSEHLVDDELFGHERGAFTGANELKRGKVELADGGTLFFDEIGELPRALQSKLLRFLEDRRFTRVGGTKDREADVRVIAATNRDLLQEVKRGTFREDLYYRLHVFPITLPPLRDHREDIPDLIHCFLRELGNEQSRKGFAIQPEAVRLLMKHDWPGNVRELRNVLERATVLSPDGEIRLEHLPPLAPPPIFCPESGTHKERMAAFERALILSTLERTHWNQSEAARRLGLNRTHFIQIMHRHEIRVSKGPGSESRLEPEE
ncbi:MAG: sigma-54 dependent transcriptional regulator [Nitrospirota bacterium]